jgi:hypothetical protein
MASDNPDGELYRAASIDVAQCRNLYVAALTAALTDPACPLAREALEVARRALCQALCIRDAAVQAGGEG